MSIINNVIFMKTLHMVAFVLLIVGGLNWLLEVFGWAIGGWGLPEMLVKIVYVLVGLAAILEVFTHKSNCKCCETKGPAPMGGQQM